MRPEVRKKSEVREFLETILGAALLAVLIMTFVARAYTVDGPSMMPTLINGERLIIDKISYRFIEPTRGEIIVFKYPSNPKEQFIKRVIGVPGDEVAVLQGQVYVNGKAIEENYIAAQARYGFTPEIVPEGHFFVLGDNRNNSEDSRSRRVGFVPMDLVVGRAVWRYWPLDRIDIMSAPEIFNALE